MARSWVALGLGVLVACSGDDGATISPPDAALDASAEAAPDVQEAAIEAAPDVPPLPPLSPGARMPGLDYLGGALLTSMKVVTVTFASDNPAVVARLQLFGDTITQTPWWTDTTSEYCVLPKGSPCIGPGSNGGHVVLNEAPPANLVDTEDGTGSTVVSFIQDHVNLGLFPPPDEQTVYQIWFPSGTTIKFDKLTSCSGFGAYHYSASLLPKGGVQYVETAYAIEPRCSGEPFLTVAGSHELLEAATDPHPGKDQGWVMQDFGWLYYGGENGDVCDYPWGFETMVESTFSVQRGWSNKSARSGHAPCVTQPKSEVYFNAAVEAGKQTLWLAVGESKTIDLDPYADGTAVDWTLSAEDISSRIGGNASLGFAFDKTTVNAGQKVKLTITLKSQPSKSVAPYVIHSQSSAGHHWWGAEVRSK